MALLGTLASLSQTAASNAADGSVDPPSTLDQQVNSLASYSAQLRDGNGFATGVGYLGQCRLVKSGSNLVLQRYNGVGLTINGVAYAIPSAGVSLAPTGSAGTNYNIYAYMNAGTMTLEASTTAHATDSTTGVEIKSGDATRTLVGKARPIAGPAWADSATQRFVISWFNRRKGNCYVQSSGALSTPLTTAQPLLSVEFLCWGDEGFHFSTNGAQSNNTLNSANANALGIDSTSVSAFVPTVWQAYANFAQGPAVASYLVSAGQLTEGYHTIYALGWVQGGGGTATWASPSGFELGGLVTV